MKKYKITLRFRMLDTGKETLYLDYYPPVVDPETKKLSRREYLGMYVYPLKNRKGEYIANKDGKYKYNSSDEETIRLAEIIRNNRQNELDKANIYTDAESEIIKAKERSKGDFIKYFQQLANEKSNANHDSWISALNHLKSYTKITEQSESIRFCDITLQWCEGFKNYILTAKSTRSDKMQLSNNTAATYFIKFKVTLKTAYKYGYLPKDLNSDLKAIKEKETRREFLTLDKLRKLVDAPCSNEVLKRAVLFSALTGLRHSDIRKMKWEEIAEADGKYTLHYTIQKTNTYQSLPISEQAIKLCGERQDPDKLVFDLLRIR